MCLRLAALLLVAALLAVVAAPADATVPRTEARRYVLGLDGLFLHVDVGQERYHVGPMKVSLHGDERFVTIRVRDVHGQPVAAVYQVNRQIGPAVVVEPFCGQTTFNLPFVGADSIEVTVVDPRITPQLYTCKPGLGTTGTVTLSFW